MFTCLNKPRDGGSAAPRTHTRKCAAWMGCWGMAVMHTFTPSMLTLQIPRSVNCKRLLTRKSVNSRHNTQSSEPIRALYRRGGKLRLRARCSVGDLISSYIYVLLGLCCCSGSVIKVAASCRPHQTGDNSHRNDHMREITR